MIGEKYLPIGTVCRLKEGKKSLMIVGFAVRQQEGENTEKVYDYLGCIYPIGIFDQNKNFMFDHENIEEVLHMGLVTDEEKEFKKQLVEELAKRGVQ